MLVILVSMVVVEAPERTAPARAEAGPIRDARLRQARRRKRVVAVAGGLATLGLLAGWLISGENSNSRPTGDAHTASPATERARRHAGLGVWSISPALEGGRYGWSLH